MTARSIAVGAVIMMALVGCRRRVSAPLQPIPFDHSIHVQLQLDSGPLACTACHPGAERGSHAGLPALSRCLRCHMRPQGDPPSRAESLVRAAAAAGGPFRWIQVTRNPGHVHFSHGAHVTRAGMSCADCHGQVSRWSRPPTTPDEGLTDMQLCIACHRQQGAPTECATCHQ